MTTYVLIGYFLGALNEANQSEIFRAAHWHSTMYWQYLRQWFLCYVRPRNMPWYSTDTQPGGEGREEAHFTCAIQYADCFLRQHNRY